MWLDERGVSHIIGLDDPGAILGPNLMANLSAQSRRGLKVLQRQVYALQESIVLALAGLGDGGWSCPTDDNRQYEHLSAEGEVVFDIDAGDWSDSLYDEILLSLMKADARWQYDIVFNLEAAIDAIRDSRRHDERG